MRLASASMFALVSLLAAPCLAVGQPEATGTGKGTIGGALLGAELVLTVEAVIDVQPTWWYYAGGAAGAVGGGVSGYFIEQSASPRVSTLMLAAGLTLAIPTTVAVLSAAAYEPPADYLQDSPPPDEPVADPPQPAEGGDSGAANAPRTPTTKRHRSVAKRDRSLARGLAPRPLALFDVDPERVALAIPALELRDVFTPTELWLFGVRQETEVRALVLSVAF